MRIGEDQDAASKPLTNHDLYEKQMAMLQSFLERGAISKEQYQISAEGLKQKMKL